MKVLAALAVAALALAQAPPSVPTVPPSAPAPVPTPEPVDPQARRIELNLLGRTNTAGGESRRNENIQFNLIDNNALKELNVRLGTTATILEFVPARGYFGTEYGNPPTPVLHLPPPRPRARRLPRHGLRIAPEQHLRRPVVLSSGQRQARARQRVRLQLWPWTLARRPPATHRVAAENPRQRQRQRPRPVAH